MSRAGLKPSLTYAISGTPGRRAEARLRSLARQIELRVSCFARRRDALKAATDGAGWAFALLVASIVRFNFEPSGDQLERVALFLPFVVLTQVLVGTACGLYSGRWWFASFEEVAALSSTVALTSAAVAGLDLLCGLGGGPRLVPVSTIIGGGFVAVVWMCAVRYLWRLRRDSGYRPDGKGSTRVLVFGAGEGGSEVIRAMMRDHRGRYLPVAILDDDPAKGNLRIMGISVVGGRLALQDAVQRLGARVVLIAIPSAGSRLVAEINRLASECGAQVKVLPRVSELVYCSIGLADIRDLTEADLLGREEVHTDVPAIAAYITGKRVLVSGAGGSIGTELCRQLHQLAPAELIMADQDGSALHAVQLSVDGIGLLDSPDLAVLDIRDRRRVHQLLEQRRPQVIFHAAALKHLTLLERYPDEALKTNVLGSLNLLEEAAAFGVERFVNISTDKAADPISVLGYSKRLAERLTAHVAAVATGTYLSVRFGNVLGTRGSVLTAFEAQIAAGKPITVTHPEVTRYFMTVEEAVQLVIQAGAIGRPGESLVLDMGEPVRIADVARRLAERADHQVDIVFTGLRPGEKLHEVLFGQREEASGGAFHPLISHVPVPPLDPEAVRHLDAHVDSGALIYTLREMCGHPAANEIGLEHQVQLTLAGATEVEEGATRGVH